MEDKSWIQAKRHLVGPFIRIPRAEIVEILALAGYDFVVADMEHGFAQMHEIYPMVLAASHRRIPFIVRVPGLQESYFKWLFDVGADGLQVPHIKSRDDAQAAVNFSKFFPEGERGLCRFVRAADFSNTPRPEYVSRANARTTLVLQIEGVEGAENISEIVEVAGIDVIFVGPYDLSQSMGLIGEIWHPRVTEKITEIVGVCDARGIATGVFTDTLEGILHWKALGVKYINYRMDTEMLLSFCRKHREEIRQLANL